MPTAGRQPAPRMWADLLSGLRFLRREPFLRATLFAAAGMQLMFAGAAFVLIANFTTRGATAGSIGGLFAAAAVGGLLGAFVAPTLQSRLRPQMLVVVLGWTSVGAFAALVWVSQPLLAGALLGCTYCAAAPANSVLSAAQISRTPESLQGRVMAASYLVAGLVAPLGPPAFGALLEATGQGVTFATLAAVTAIITVAVHLNRPMRTLPNPAA